MKVIICGYQGKMGNLVYQRLKKDPRFEIVALLEKENNCLTNYLTNKIDVVIDFTNSETAINNAYHCLENNINFLSGTTGINEKILKKISQKVKEKGLSFIICPNFSLGINLILKSLSMIKPYFDEIKIIEQHHISKKDKPSGTALAIKRYLNEEDIKIKSIRKETNTLFHKVILKKENEEIILTHLTTSREAYVEGVIYGLEKMNTFKGLKRTLNF